MPPNLERIQKIVKLSIIPAELVNKPPVVEQAKNTPTTTKPKIFVQLGHPESVGVVAFSPDGKLALSGSEDDTMKLWEVATGRELRTFKGHSWDVRACLRSFETLKINNTIVL